MMGAGIETKELRDNLFFSRLEKNCARSVMLDSCCFPFCLKHTRVLLDNPLNEELARVDQNGDDVRDAAEANDVVDVEEDGREPGLLQNEEARASGDERVEGAREPPLKHDAPEQQRRDALDVGHERDGGLLECVRECVQRVVAIDSEIGQSRSLQSK